MGEAKRRVAARKRREAGEADKTRRDFWLAFMCLPHRERVVEAMRPMLQTCRVSTVALVAERLSRAHRLDRGRFVGEHPGDSAMAKAFAQVTNNAARGRRLMTLSAVAVIAAAGITPTGH